MTGVALLPKDKQVNFGKLQQSPGDRSRKSEDVSVALTTEKRTICTSRAQWFVSPAELLSVRLGGDFFLPFFFVYFWPFFSWLCVGGGGGEGSAHFHGETSIFLGKPLFSLYFHNKSLQYVSGSSPSSCPIYTMYSIYNINSM